jgi:LysM repeat protein
VLVHLVTLDVPDARITTPAGLTLLTLASAYGLALETLAGRMAEDAGVLDQALGGPLGVPDVPEMALADLTAAMHEGKSVATVSGQVSRFMLNGLRLPAPELKDGKYHATGHMTGAYELTGQQVTGPPPPKPPLGGDPEPPVVTITVEKGQTAGWLTLEDAVIEITASDLTDNYPATGLQPVVLEPPRAAAPVPGRRRPLRRPARHPVADDGRPGVAGPAARLGAAELVAAARRPDGACVRRHEHVAVPAGPDHGADRRGRPRPPSWGPTPGGRWWRSACVASPGWRGTVEVFGADTADRQRLALVLEYLEAIPDLPAAADFPDLPEGEAAHLKLLWQLPPTPGMTPGLTSIPLVDTGTFIVQTNLSTETRSALATSAGPTSGKHYASIADAERFLTLLWECSVVGGGGYWMRLQGRGAEVPDSIFDQDGLASLSLLIQLDSQSTDPPDRHLLAFNNVAVVGDGVDPATVALTAHAVDPPELTPAPSLDPGQVGFAAEYANPGGDDSAEGRLRRLYGLLGFQLTPTEVFDGSDEGPADRAAPAEQPRRPRARGLRRGRRDGVRLERVVDINRFSRFGLPTLPSAPPPGDDPYAGITAGALTAAEVWFQDVFGNVSATPEPVPVPVRYTDPLLGPGSWPSTTASYTVVAAGGPADVTVDVDLQAVAYQPVASDPGRVAAEAAGQAWPQLAAAYYQVMQPDVHASLLTVAAAGPGGRAGAVARRRRCAAPLRHRRPRLRRLGRHDRRRPGVGGTVDDVVVAYGVGYDSLAAANASAVLSTLLDATSLAVPVSVAFRNGDTVAGLCDTIDPPPDPATVLRDEDNVVLPLMPGVELITPVRDLVVGPDPPTAADLAEQAWCTLATLVTANETRTGLLTPGFVFECNGVRIAVAPDPPGSDTTLALVAQAFVDRGVPYDAAQVVALNADEPGMFRSDARLDVDGYIVVSGDTLEENRVHLTPDQLAPLNTATVDLFPPGTPLFLTTVTTAVPAEATLASFAADHGTTPGALLRHNGSVSVSTKAPPAVPGTWAWPGDVTAIVAPYTVQHGDALAEIAQHFEGADARSLVRANAAMPAPSPGTSRSPSTSSRRRPRRRRRSTRCAACSPRSCRSTRWPTPSRRGPTCSPAGHSSRARGACSPPTSENMPSVAASRPTTRPARSVWGRSRCSPPTRARPTCCSRARRWRPGPERSGHPRRSRPPRPTTTLTAVVERFRRAGIATSIETIVSANADVAFLRAGAAVLVPPATAQLTGRVGSVTPGGITWTFPDAVFPLRVTLELARDEALVDPTLAGAAGRDRAAVPAARPTDDSQDAARTLAAFAADLQAAVPVLRVATGQVLGGDTDVWAVDFGSTGIADVTVTPPLTIDGKLQPRTFAIRPLASTLIARQAVFTQALDVSTAG